MAWIRKSFTFSPVPIEIFLRRALIVLKKRPKQVEVCEQPPKLRDVITQTLRGRTFRGDLTDDSRRMGSNALTHWSLLTDVSKDHGAFVLRTGQSELTPILSNISSVIARLLYIQEVICCPKPSRMFEICCRDRSLPSRNRVSIYDALCERNCICHVNYTVSRDAPVGLQKRTQVTQRHWNLSDKDRESEPVRWFRVKHWEGTGDWVQLKELHSSCLHRASMAYKHFIIQLKHKYIIRRYN